MGRKGRINMVNLRGGKLLFLLVIYLLFIPIFCVFASEDEQELNPGSKEIQAEIDDLAAPIDAQKIGSIRNAILQKTSEDQKYLNEYLNEHIKNMFGTANSPTTDAPDIEHFDAAQSQLPLSPESIKAQIDFLRLGQNATADDLIKRDKIVENISTIQDPDLRSELLNYLESKEKITSN